MSLWGRRIATGATGAPDAGATQVPAGSKRPTGSTRPDTRWTGGFLSIGTVLTVVGALSATLLGGGLATKHTEILDGNTWLLASARDGVERVLRVNPGSGEVDLNTPSPATSGKTLVEQSNATTAVIDATTGDTYAWNPVGGQWQKSTTRITGDTALHLTTTAAFTVDRKNGIVRQLDPTLLSTSIGSTIDLGGAVSESTVDGSGQLWLALGQAKRVVSVQSSDQGPTISHQFSLPSSGSALTLTALQSGALVSDAVGRTSYRLFPDRSAAERITGTPSSTASVSAASSDDDTGAALDPATGTLTRIAPAGDKRASSVTLNGSVSGHRFGRPVVFGNDVYLPDYTAGDVLRTTPDGKIETYPPQPLAAGGGNFDLFVDDGRLWVNAPNGAKAFAVDRDGHWTPITKFEQRRIELPKTQPTREKPAKMPSQPKNTVAPPIPGNSTGDQGKKQADPKPTVPPTPTSSPTPKPTRKPTPTPTPSPTPATPPGAPGNLAAAPKDGSLTVTWEAPTVGVDDVTGYRVEWTDPDGTADNTKTDAAARQYVIPGLKNGVAYTVTVTALTADTQSAPAQITSTPLTTATGDLSAVTASGRGQITVSYDVNAHDSGAVNCEIMVNGTQRWTGGCTGAGSQVIPGLAYSTAYDVYLQMANSQGPTVSPHRSVTTWAAPTVTIRKGPSAVGFGTPKCTDPSCAFVIVHIANFTPNVTYTMDCNSSRGGGFPTHPITAGADGSQEIYGMGITYYFGYKGSSIWVTVDGISSAHLVW